MAAERFIIQGVVQGVGYRWWAMNRARRLRLFGWVRNRRDGTVELLAIGDIRAINDLAEACHDGPPSAEVIAVNREPAEDDGSRNFGRLPTL